MTNRKGLRALKASLDDGTFMERYGVSRIRRLVRVLEEADRIAIREGIDAHVGLVRALDMALDVSMEAHEVEASRVKETWDVGRDELLALEGCGDTIRKGDVVLVDNDSYPVRIEAIYARDEAGVGPDVLWRRIDDGSEYRARTSATSGSAYAPGWTRIFKKLSQAEVDAWFEKTKASLYDGWHSLTSGLGLFRTFAGVPVEVQRTSTLVPMAYVAELVGTQTGYALKMRAKYLGESRTNKQVREAVRVSAPRI